MERPVLKNFFKDKKLKDVQETYLKTPELYAYAQSLDNYADWLEERYNEACGGNQQLDTESESFVCGHPFNQTYLNEGIWHCEKCGGKWESISNK
jgi:hypothetical protein